VLIEVIKHGSLHKVRYHGRISKVHREKLD
jgi:hypothetical protein